MWLKITAIVTEKDMSQGRSVWRLIFENFKKSLSLLPPKGKFVGEDELGNKYFEAPDSYKTSKKHPVRWFEPLKEEDWQQNLPAEWEAWLRNRRKFPPTVEEVMKNAAMSQMKKVKGDEIRQKRDKERGYTIQDSASSPLSTGGFPTLEGLERDPGSSKDEKKS